MKLLTTKKERLIRMEYAPKPVSKLAVIAFPIIVTVLVSLLAPGPIEQKATRVAAAFGQAAGGIGIVIALAAIIGTCMMDSGAADRIVRAFVRLLGEKRASVA